MQYSSFKRKGFSSQKSKEEIEQQLSKEVSKEDFKKVILLHDILICLFINVIYGR